MSRVGGREFTKGSRPVIWPQKCSEQKQLVGHITFEAWKMCIKDRLTKLAGALWESNNRSGEQTDGFWNYQKSASLISSARQIVYSLASDSHDCSFPHEEILHNHFSSKFSLSLLSLTPLSNILHFTNKVKAAAATSHTTADVKEIQQEVSAIIFSYTLP